MAAPGGWTAEERAYYSLSARVYARFAPFYDLVTVPLQQLRREVVQASGCDRRSRVLDVATGTGAQAHAFSAIAREVIGVDLSAAMLEVARRKRGVPNLTFSRADATALPFGAADFDVCCISFALHEMPETVRERALREMVRVTRPDGTVVVVDYALPAGALARWLVFHAVKLYERDLYADFVRRDLGGLLERVGVRVREERRRVLGTARIVIASKELVANRARPSGDGEATSRS